VTPELSRSLSIERISSPVTRFAVEATAAERAAIAARLLIPAVHSLSCVYELMPGSGGGVAARGHRLASVIQVCVVTLEEFEVPIEEPFRLRFVPAGSETDDDDPESEDEVPYEGHAIDLGEATVEQLALALDPYPRKPGAALAVEADEEAAHPMAKLAALRRPS
jgi:uncharacterized metal-binding protein YceD (DUF177 family)